MKAKMKFFLPLISVLLLAGCNKIPTSATPVYSVSTTTSQGGTTNGEATQNNHDNVFTYQAATALGLVDYTREEVQTMRRARTLNTTDLAALKTKIESYLPTIEAALNGEEAIASSTTATSDREGYTTMTSVSYSDLNDTSTSFVLYYNEHITETDGLETEYRIDGIALLPDGTEYPLVGERETEQGEEELEFIYYLSTDRRSYVRTSQESEHNEKEFEYEMVVDGVTIVDYSLEIENNEVELEFLDGTTHTYNEIKVDVHTQGTETYLRVKLGDDNEDDKVRILYRKNADGTYTEVVNP